MDPWKDHETTDSNPHPSMLANFVFSKCVCVCVREIESKTGERGGDQGHEIHVIVLSNKTKSTNI